MIIGNREFFVGNLLLKSNRKIRINIDIKLMKKQGKIHLRRLINKQNFRMKKTILLLLKNFQLCLKKKI